MILLSDYAKGIDFLTLAAIPLATGLSCPEARFCFVVLDESRWRLPGLLRSTLPDAVILKRLAIDFLVFCISVRNKVQHRIRFFLQVKNKKAEIPRFLAGTLRKRWHLGFSLLSKIGFFKEFCAAALSSLPYKKANASVWGRGVLFYGIMRKSLIFNKMRGIEAVFHIKVNANFQKTNKKVKIILFCKKSKKSIYL